MTLSPAVWEWLQSNDTGLSSKTIVFTMEQNLIKAHHPLDPADLGRCIRLLDIEPSYRARLNEMANVSPEWARLVERWADLEALYREEYPSGHAPKCYAMMQECIRGDK